MTQKSLFVIHILANDFWKPIHTFMYVFICNTPTSACIADIAFFICYEEPWNVTIFDDKLNGGQCLIRQIRQIKVVLQASRKHPSPLSSGVEDVTKELWLALCPRVYIFKPNPWARSIFVLVITGNSCRDVRSFDLLMHPPPTQLCIA